MGSVTKTNRGGSVTCQGRTKGESTALSFTGHLTGGEVGVVSVTKTNRGGSVTCQGRTKGESTALSLAGQQAAALPIPQFTH